jgi:hypothetical protein
MRLGVRWPVLVHAADVLRGNRRPIWLDFAPEPRPRWQERPHSILYEILDRERESYRKTLGSFLAYADKLEAVPVHRTKGTPVRAPTWLNGFLPGLDAVSLYGFLASLAPRTYVEVGSGNSTRFARRAIEDQGLSTRIVSIDPHPRAEIDDLCDVLIRQPLESVDLSIFTQLQAGDVVFIDDSHLALPNSDVTVLFLEILPSLPRGVVMQIHDIYLPYDYPPDVARRWYSEQYLLACYLLAGGSKFEVLLPNMFVTRDAELSGMLSPLWARPGLKEAERTGGSFWLRMR